MKTRFRSLLAVAGLLVLNASAVSLAQTTDTVSNVPFTFNVGSAELPRDTYTITKVSGHMSAYQIRGLRAAAIMISQPDGPDAADPSPRLVFHRIGDKYLPARGPADGEFGIHAAGVKGGDCRGGDGWRSGAPRRKSLLCLHVSVM